MIVVDTNVVAYFAIAGTRTVQAEAVRARDHDWHVPNLFLHEWLNVVTLHIYRKILTRDQALRVYQRGLALVTVEDARPDPVRVINLHVTSHCSSYDCQFIATAEKHGTQLVTSDAAVLRAFPGIAVNIETFS